MQSMAPTTTKPLFTMPRAVSCILLGALLWPVGQIVGALFGAPFMLLLDALANHPTNPADAYIQSQRLGSLVMMASMPAGGALLWALGVHAFTKRLRWKHLLAIFAAWLVAGGVLAAIALTLDADISGKSDLVANGVFGAVAGFSGALAMARVFRQSWPEWTWLDTVVTAVSFGAANALALSYGNDNLALFLSTGLLGGLFTVGALWSAAGHEQPAAEANQNG